MTDAASANVDPRTVTSRIRRALGSVGHVDTQLATRGIQ